MKSFCVNEDKRMRENERRMGKGKEERFKKQPFSSVVGSNFL